MDADERTLGRIMATLVALASLAERSALRSFLVRWFVLVALRRAETVLRRYVAGVTGIDVPLFADDAEPGCGASEAALVASRLRWLAALVGALLDAACAVHAWTAALDGRRLRAPESQVIRHRATPGDGTVQPFDTS